MKRLFILLLLAGWTSTSFTQSTPTITVQKLLDSNDSYSSNLYGKTDSILAGQQDTFKIIISEPSQEQSDFFSNNGQLMLLLPGDALQFGNNHDDGNGDNDLNINTLNSLPDVTLTYNSITEDKDTIIVDIEVEAPLDKQDEIVIENLIIEFPANLADGDDFELKAWADFMDTSGDDSSPLA